MVRSLPESEQLETQHLEERKLFSDGGMDALIKRYDELVGDVVQGDGDLVEGRPRCCRTS